jgi:hypothetical protein
MMVNKAWHDKHKMPQKANIEAKIKWHIAHHKNCQCRPVPSHLKAEMTKRGIKL